MLDQEQWLSLYLECCTCLLDVMEKLGVADNIDIVELVFRTFLYASTEQMASPQLQSLVDDSLQLLLSQLESMSVGLEMA